MMYLKQFLLIHAGKGTAGVCLADLLIAWPDSLSWMVAGCALWWAIQHFRQAFRSLDAEPQLSPVAVVLRAEAAPNLSEVDPLDPATQLDMGARDSLPAAVPGRELVPAAMPVWQEERWQRQPA